MGAFKERFRRRGRPAARRRPVPGRQGPHRGGALPHLQRPARLRPAAGDDLRPQPRTSSTGSRSGSASASAPASWWRGAAGPPGPPGDPREARATRRRRRAGRSCWTRSPPASSTSVRALEAALIQVVAYASLRGETPDARARAPAAQAPRARTPRRVAVHGRGHRRRHRDPVRPQAAESCMARDRRPAVARARKVAMYLARELTDQSLPEIGRGFGGRDHSTVLSAVRSVAAEVRRDPELAMAVESLKQTPRRGPADLRRDCKNPQLVRSPRVRRSPRPAAAKSLRLSTYQQPLLLFSRLD